MRRLSCIIILHLLFSACSSFNGFLATARIFHDHQPNSPHSPVNKILGGDIKRSRVNVLDNMERDIGKCGLYILVKTVGGDFELRATHLRERSPETLTTKPFCLRNRSWSCLSYHGLLYFYFSKHHACGSSVELLLKQSNVLRRSLADKSPKAPASTAASPSAASPSSESTDDDSIIIPPELLFQPPPPPTTSDQSSTTGASQERQNNDLNKIITIVASVAGIVVIFSLALFCCVMRRRRGFQNKQRDDKPLLTLSSSDFSAGSSRNSDNKEFGREASFDGSSAQPEPRRVTPLADIPENVSVNGANAEGSTLQIHANGDSTPLPAAAPPPPPKPKAPPPPPKGVRPPPAPPIAGGKGPHQRGRSTSGDGNEITGDPDGPRTKLKPFFWDKVVGSPDHSMVWDEIRAGSFQFNEERIESLFGYHPDDKRNNDRRGRPSDASQAQYVQIIDAKKSQNLSILLKALNVTTEEVCDAVVEGNELPPELLQTLLRMAPTQEEELKLRLFAGDLSQLGPAERFLKVMVDIPFAFKRMDSLMFMMTFKEEVSSMKESFVTLEVACDELKKSRLFLKLLEAVLKTGNRMNDGTFRGGAQAIKLDTLLKLADVKGTDGKTTLLHFVVQEIIRAEGLKAVRAAKENCSISSMKSDDFVDDPNFDSAEQYRILGLQVVSSISSELENVKKAAVIDADGLTTTVSKLGQSLAKIKNLMKNEMDSYEEESGFYLALASFLEHSEDEVTWLTEEEQRISNLVRKTADYFHGNAGREEGLRLFSIVRDFLIMLDKICAQLKQSLSKPTKNTGKDTSPKRPSQDPQQSIQDMRERLFPAIAERRMVDSSSDSDSD